MKPKDVKTSEDVCSLGRDNVDTAEAWIIFNHPDEIVITNQRAGEKSTGSVRMTRRTFARFVKWWETGE